MTDNDDTRMMWGRLIARHDDDPSWWAYGGGDCGGPGDDPPPRSEWRLAPLPSFAAPPVGAVPTTLTAEGMADLGLTRPDVLVLWSPNESGVADEVWQQYAEGDPPFGTSRFKVGRWRRVAGCYGPRGFVQVSP